jgi:hypothetical protein
MSGLANLPYRKWGTRGYKTPYEYTLLEDLYADQWIIPKGTIVKLWTTQNFGYVILPKNCQDKRGFTIPRRIFRW